MIEDDLKAKVGDNSLLSDDFEGNFLQLKIEFLKLSRK